MVFLTDRYPQRDLLPIHALLATGAVHAHLIESGLRCQCNMLVETGHARDAHQFACLIGFGATAIYPWLAYQSLFELGRADTSPAKGAARDRPQLSARHPQGPAEDPVEDGHLHVAGYRGAQLFEIVGLAPEVVALCFPGTPSRIGGAGFAELEHDQRLLAAPSLERGAAAARRRPVQVRARRRVPHVQPGRDRPPAAGGAHRRWPTTKSTPHW
jgi:glutamate synthase (NADPH/NADH) large chain